MISPFQLRRNSLRYIAPVVAALVAILWTSGNLGAQDTPKFEPLALVTSSGEYKFNVEIAVTRDQQSRGLMFRRSMDPRQGMLFIYNEPQYVSMWMRNAYISLDMVFIGAEGKVHRVEASTEPLSERIIESGDKILAVLELVGGTAARLNLKPGDVVRHRAFKSRGN